MPDSSVKHKVQTPIPPKPKECQTPAILIWTSVIFFMIFTSLLYTAGQSYKIVILTILYSVVLALVREFIEFLSLC
jgi:hypothetical protein